MNLGKSYEVSPTTLAIIPNYHEKHQTKILDLYGEYVTSISSIRLIDSACLEGGSSLDGRRKSLRHKKSFHQCPPIPIDPLEDIYAFPTCSPDSHDCMWIFYEHILRAQPINNSTLITFQNFQTLEVPISIAVMEKQISRTESCIVLFSKPRKRARMNLLSHSFITQETSPPSFTPQIPLNDTERCTII